MFQVLSIKPVLCDHLCKKLRGAYVNTSDLSTDLTCQVKPVLKDICITHIPAYSSAGCGSLKTGFTMQFVCRNELKCVI